MKKLLMLMLVVTILLVTGLVVYAEAEDVEVPEWFEDMMDWRRGEIDEALEDGTITEDEANAWLERLDEMETFHMEEGFNNFGAGSCPGGGKGFSGGRGFGGGCRGGGY